MSLVYAAALLSASVVLARLVYVGNRLPKTPWWAREGLTTFLILVVVGAVSLGAGMLLEAIVSWERQVVGVGEVAAVAGMLVAAVVLWKLMGRGLPAATGDTAVPGSPARDGPDAPGRDRPSPVSGDPKAGAPRKAA